MDNLSMGQRAVADELLRCFTAWERGVRVLGNVQAGDAADLMRAILATQPPAVGVDELREMYEHVCERAKTAEDAAADEMENADRLANALRNLVKINEDHNAACEKVIGRPVGWKDEYLDDARAALTAALRTGGGE